MCSTNEPLSIPKLPAGVNIRAAGAWVSRSPGRCARPPDPGPESTFRGIWPPKPPLLLLAMIGIRGPREPVLGAMGESWPWYDRIPQASPLRDYAEYSI